MRRLICILAVATMALCAAPASAAILIITPAEPGTPPLETKSLTIEAVVNGPVAQVTLDQVFHNPGTRDDEGWLTLSIPAGASVTDLELLIGGERVRAAAMDRDEARRVYTDIVRRAKDPALLEMIDATTYRVRIFPVPAGGDMPVRVSYAQPVRQRGDFKALAIHGTERPRLAPGFEGSISVDLAGAGKAAVAYSPTHALHREETGDGVRLAGSIGPADFGRTVEVLFAPAGGEGGALVVSHWESDDGTFLALIAPPAQDGEINAVPKQVTFVLDVSGSMNDGGKMEQAKAALSQCLGFLGEEDAFNIITFSSRASLFSPSPISAAPPGIAEARTFIDGIRAGGGTNIDEAMQMALDEQPEGDLLHQIVFLTDGQPTVGVTAEDQILDRFRKRGGGDLRVFTLGVGSDVNTNLLDAFASETRALTDYIRPGEDVELAVSAFYRAVATPVVTDLSLRIEGGATSDIHPAELPDLFAGRDLVVVGRFAEPGRATIHLEGRQSGGEPYAVSVETEFERDRSAGRRYVGQLWASRKIGFLMADYTRGSAPDEVRQEIIDLGLRYDVPTMFTSLLALEDEPRPAPVVAGGRPGGTRDRGAAAPAPTVAFEQNVMRGADGMNVMSSPAPADPSRAGYDFAVAQNQLQLANQAQAGASLVYRTRHQAFQTVQGRIFDERDGAWVERGRPENLREVRVQYLSEAYFALLDRFEARRPSITQGERVALQLDAYWVVIGEEGLEDRDELDNALATPGGP